MAGCSEDPPPPIGYGAAKPAGDRLGLRAPPGSVVTLSQWPDACNLVTDPEIRAILPQATDIERKPVMVTVSNFNPLRQADPGTTGEVPRGGCEFEFALPTGGDSTSYNSSFTVTVTAVADPAVVASRYLEDKSGDSQKSGFKDLAASWGTQGCYSTGDGLSAGANCYQGPYLFDVGGSSWADGVAPKPDPDATAAENIAAEKQRQQIWADKVLSQVTRTVAARMS
jgi:hypothetical protein